MQIPTIFAEMTLPYFGDYIYTKDLLQVKPESINIQYTSKAKITESESKSGKP